MKLRIFHLLFTGLGCVFFCCMTSYLRIFWNFYITHPFFYGTYWKAWETIRNNGLKRTKQKKYINLQPGHLSGDGSKLTDLVKKFKNNCEVLVYIDLARAISEGIKFFKTGSGMVVTTGDHNQKIPPRYFLKAVHISPTTGDQIWIESLGNHDIVNTNEIISGLENMGGPNLAEYQNFQDTYANSNSNYSGDSDNNSDYVGRTKQLLFKAKAPVNQTHSLQTGMFNSTPCNTKTDTFFFLSKKTRIFFLKFE